MKDKDFIIKISNFVKKRKGLNFFVIINSDYIKRNTIFRFYYKSLNQIHYF